MAKRTTGASNPKPDTEADVFDPQIEANRAAAADQAQNESGPAGKTYAATVPKKEYKADPDPFGFENIKGEGNRVRLLKSENHGAWVIRFEKSPNQMDSGGQQPYSSENPHPVITMLKKEGYRWGFDDGDGKGGWGKAFTGDAYGQDHIEARRVLRKAAEMIGADVEQAQER